MTDLQEEKAFREALDKAMQLCSTREKCITELLAKLTIWKVSEKYHDPIIDFLIKENFLDENRYAASFAHDKFHFNKWGKAKIRLHLKQKNVSESDISQALEAISDEDYYDVLYELLEKKFAATKDKNTYSKKGKLMRYAQSKGFEPDLIYAILEELFS